jgi:hypothetical protein
VAQTRYFVAFQDPSGPVAARLAVPLFGVAVAIASRVLAGSAAAPGVWAGFALAAASPFLLGRFPLTNATLLVEPGRVRVRGAGLANQTFRPRDVAAFGVAPLARSQQSAFGFVESAEGEEETRFIVAIRRRSWLGTMAVRPSLVVVDDLETVEALRNALGVNRSSSSHFSWPLRGGTVGGRIALVLGCLFAACTAVLGGAWAHVGLRLLFPCWFAALIEVLINLFGTPARSLAFRAEGVAHDGRLVPWAEIAAVTFERDSWLQLARIGLPPMFFRAVPQRHGRDGLSPLDFAFLASYIEKEARMRRGEEGGAAYDRPALLAFEGDTEGWLARLDGADPDRADYRQGGVSRQDLLGILENPDASWDARAGAGRILLRVASTRNDAELRTRIADARATVADEGLADLLDAFGRGDDDAARSLCGRRARRP